MAASTSTPPGPPEPVGRNSKGRDAATSYKWDRLSRPVQVLVGVGVATGVVVIYNGASGLIGHVFNVVLLFLFASVVALILNPVVDLLQRLPGFRSHRGPAVLALYLVIFSAIGGVVALVIPNLVDQAKHIPQLVSQLQHGLADRGIDVNLGAVLPSSSSLPGNAVSVVAGVATTVADIILVVVISIYLLIDGRGLVATMRNLFPENPHRFDFALLATGSTMAAYVRGQSLMSLIIGAYTALTLTLIGVHYAIVIGVAAFLLEFVPIIGAILAMALAVVVALLQGPLVAGLAAIAGLVGHALEAYVVGPRIAGHVTKLHPLVAMAALLIGADVGGILGALFAVPLAAIANIFLGAFYRSRRGEVAITTADDGTVDAESLPRLGDEIEAVEDAGVEGRPVPHFRDAADGAE
ncbi:MAG: AI-2E family transporter [Candidatus Dormibacteraeota bacterium]|uniref:AI-2E family transporter n=1 Tax=Candidatus Aeolococcus gillhamiae TaxID=3127015 RepID=A0A934K4X5_9BACT|nr:AI-2E family transporter [Candidatus Dormibacteraeota bacterium]